MDLTTGVTADELRGKGQPKQGWEARLSELWNAVNNGDAEWETFYCVGRFKNASGARTALRSILKRSAVPCVVDLHSLIVIDKDGNKVSELWASIPELLDDDTDDPELGTRVWKEVA